MNCNICQTIEILTEEQKRNLRSDWAGVDFYTAICSDCFEIQKEIR